MVADPDLVDHHSVLNRPPVPGMGGINVRTTSSCLYPPYSNQSQTYFFTHTWAESKDFCSSWCNEMEADMITGLFRHLTTNGLESKNITVLTFYNGQKHLIMRSLRAYPALRNARLEVKTVDSYQGTSSSISVASVQAYRWYLLGEENEVVLLSLVRSNDVGQVGFVSVSRNLIAPARIHVCRLTREYRTNVESVSLFP